jgi:FdhD protein
VPEAPVALEFNGLSYAVMMATPSDLEDFATGFALTEGLAASREQVADIAIAEVELGWIFRAALAAPLPVGAGAG